LEVSVSITVLLSPLFTPPPSSRTNQSLRTLTGDLVFIYECMTESTSRSSTDLGLLQTADTQELTFPDDEQLHLLNEEELGALIREPYRQRRGASRSRSRERSPSRASQSGSSDSSGSPDSIGSLARAATSRRVHFGSPDSLGSLARAAASQSGRRDSPGAQPDTPEPELASYLSDSLDRSFPYPPQLETLAETQGHEWGVSLRDSLRSTSERWSAATQLSQRWEAGFILGSRPLGWEVGFNQSGIWEVGVRAGDRLEFVQHAVRQRPQTDSGSGSLRQPPPTQNRIE